MENVEKFKNWRIKGPNQKSGTIEMFSNSLNLIILLFRTKFDLVVEEIAFNAKNHLSVELKFLNMKATNQKSRSIEL